MKQIIILLLSLTFLFSLDSFAQLRPAQSQYFQEKGALVNPSFEQGYKGWEITGTCTQSLVSDIPYLNKTLKLTCVNQQFSVKQNTTQLTGFVNQQALLTAQVKASVGGMTVDSLANDVVQSTASVIAGDYKSVNIAVKVNSINNGVQYSATNVTGDFYIDDVSLRLAPDLSYQVGQAQFVGRAYFSDQDCDWNNTVSSYAALSAVSACEVTTVTGNISVPSPATSAKITIDNFRTDGFYHVSYQGLIYNNSNTATCFYNLTKEIGVESENGETYVTATQARADNYIDGTFRFEQGDTGDVHIQAYNNGGGQCSVRGQTNFSGAWKVHFYPDSQSTIVSQQTELTAATANAFNAIIDSSGNVSNENYDWIDGNCTVASTGVYDCDLISGLFTERLNCLATPRARSNQASYAYNNSTNVLAQFATANASGTASSQDFNVQCETTGSDVNKSQTIIGKFEQIEEVTADLTAATANELTLNHDAAGIVTDFNFTGWYDSFTKTGTGSYTVNYVSLGLTVPPTILVTTGGSCRQTGEASSPSTTSYSYDTRSTSGSPFDCRSKLVLIKNEPDYNKSFTGAVINASQSAQTIADIVREDIISTDLIKIKYHSNDGSVADTSTPFDFLTKVEDNFNLWNGTSFTSPRTTSYKITGLIRNTTAATSFVTGVFLDGVLQHYCSDNIGGGVVRLISCAEIKVNAGQVVSIRPNGTITQNTADDENTHLISITELPDTASIVENLNQNPRVSLQDQYSETEIEWGLWNGQQLYRRCFTVASDITADNPTFATWGTGLRPVNAIGYQNNIWVLKSVTENGSSTRFIDIRYNDLTGAIGAATTFSSAWKILQNTSFCMDYTK